MPTTLGRKFDLDWRGDPPHMLAEDVPVWYRFLEKWGFMFTALYYDCCVGGPYYTKKQLEDPMARMWRANTSKRIDAVAETAGEVWIIEVAKAPGLRALGQVQAYRALWIEDPPIAKIEKAVLVVQMVDPDLISAIAMYGVLSYVMPRPKSEVSPSG